MAQQATSTTVTGKSGKAILAQQVAKTLESGAPISGHDVAARSATMRKVMTHAARIQGKIDANMGQVSQELLDIARTFQHSKHIRTGDALDGSRNKEASAEFENACAVEEKWVRSPEAGKLEQSTLPRCWTQAKSNIKAALQFGIDLSKFKSEAAMRAEKVRVNGLIKKDDFSKAMESLVKDLKALPTAEAMGIIQEAHAAIAAARQALKQVLPEEPSAPEAVANN